MSCILKNTDYKYNNTTRIALQEKFFEFFKNILLQTQINIEEKLVWK